MTNSIANSKIPRWLEWAREIQALSQTGYHFSEIENAQASEHSLGNYYHLQRYRRLSEIAAEIIAGYTDMDSSQLMETFCAQTGYATPRVDVRSAVFREEKLLLVRERMDGGWTLPGGWADVGDTPSDAAEREVWEEAGFLVKAQKVIGVYDANRISPLELFHAFKIVFLCELISGEPRPSQETSDVAFFSKDELPQFLSGERTTPRHIRDAFAARENPGLPTVFD
jgi:ADP-ribose pyrophosphatase YjhB (NUDIX family)